MAQVLADNLRLQVMDALHDVWRELARQFAALREIAFGFAARTLHQPGHAPIGVTQRIARIEFERAAIIGDGSVEVALGAAGVGAIVPALYEIGIEFDGPAVIGDSAVPVSFVIAQIAAIAPGGGAARVEPDGLIEIGERAFRLPQRNSGIAAIVPGRRVFFIDPDDLIKVGDAAWKSFCASRAQPRL